MKYACCVCGHEFRSNDAVDGFCKGYAKGFLCPACGANIDVPLGTRPRLPADAKSLASTLVGMIVLALFAARAELGIDLPSGHFPLWQPLGLAALALMLLLIALFPRVLFDPTLVATAIDAPTESASPTLADDQELHCTDGNAIPEVKPVRLAVMAFGAVFMFVAVRDILIVGGLAAISAISGFVGFAFVGLSIFGSAELLVTLSRQRRRRT